MGYYRTIYDPDTSEDDSDSCVETHDILGLAVTSINNDNGVWQHNSTIGSIFEDIPNCKNVIEFLQ